MFPGETFQMPAVPERGQAGLTDNTIPIKSGSAHNCRQFGASEGAYLRVGALIEHVSYRLRREPVNESTCLAPGQLRPRDAGTVRHIEKQTAVRRQPIVKAFTNARRKRTSQREHPDA